VLLLTWWSPTQLADGVVTAATVLRDEGGVSQGVRRQKLFDALVQTLFNAQTRVHAQLLGPAAGGASGDASAVRDAVLKAFETECDIIDKSARVTSIEARKVRVAAEREEALARTRAAAEAKIRALDSAASTAAKVHCAALQASQAGLEGSDIESVEADNSIEVEEVDSATMQALIAVEAAALLQRRGVTLV